MKEDSYQYLLFHPTDLVVISNALCAETGCCNRTLHFLTADNTGCVMYSDSEAVVLVVIVVICHYKCYKTRIN